MNILPSSPAPAAVSGFLAGLFLLMLSICVLRPGLPLETFSGIRQLRRER